MQETWIQSLNQEDPLENGMAIHSSILAWRIPWTDELGGYSPWDCEELDIVFDPGNSVILSLELLTQTCEKNVM